MSRAALLVMDVQRGIVDRFSDDAPALLGKLSQATAAARNHEIPVIYVRVGFRPGAPEVNPRNRTFAALAGSSGFGLDDPATRIHEAVTPQPQDFVVVKKRVSAFAGSDLEVLVRSLDITHLVLTGIATSGVVLSTVRQAADLDYQLTVLSDGCADGDAEVHTVLLHKVFPRQAVVTTVDEWVAGLAGNG